MASVEIREGFLCPMCMQDLGTVMQLTTHFEEEHSSEDKDVINQLKGLFDKAKKKILKKEREDEIGAVPYIQDRPVTAAARVSGTDPTLWEPQTLGATRSYTDAFKGVRDTRIDRFVIETNKLLIRLDKLVSPDIPSDPNKRKAYEKTVVPWAQDSEVLFCVTCGKRFTVTRRRHHCRLCGTIMCNTCSQFLPLEYAKKLTNPSFHYEGEGFRRSGSNSSLNSMFTPEGEMQIRTCANCRTLLERRDQQMEQRKAKPLLTQMYEKMKNYIEETDRLLPYFMKMTDALNAGETTYSLEDAQMLRMKVMKLYENVDSLSKRIQNHGLDHPEELPSQKQLQLQRMIRLYVNSYLQENLMGLQSLPTAEQYEKIKERRKEEIQHKIEMEKQAAIERARQAEQREKDQERVVSGQSEVKQHRRQGSDSKQHKRQGSKGFVQDKGWKPAEIVHGNSEDDPMIQQMNIIKGYIKQAKEADRWDEAQMLEENLKELQREYLRQQKVQAVSTDTTQYPSNTTQNVQSPPAPASVPSSQPSPSHKSLQNRLLNIVKPQKKSLNPFEADYEESVHKDTAVSTTKSSNKSTNPFDDV